MSWAKCDSRGRALTKKEAERLANAAKPKARKPIVLDEAVLTSLRAQAVPKWLVPKS